MAGHGSGVEPSLEDPEVFEQASFTDINIVPLVDIMMVLLVAAYPSKWYSFKKFAGRNKTALIAALLVSTALLAATLFSMRSASVASAIADWCNSLLTRCVRRHCISTRRWVSNPPGGTKMRTG